MQTIAIEEAEGHLGEIIEKLAPGEEVVITKGDKAVATVRAVPQQEPEPRRFGTLKGTILYIAPDFDDIPEGFEDYLP
jgi:antitoxin (DNA-binding transcriptional repressor) of toxin-antitoxin stability system